MDGCDSGGLELTNGGAPKAGGANRKRLVGGATRLVFQQSVTSTSWTLAEACTQVDRPAPLDHRPVNGVIVGYFRRIVAATTTFLRRKFAA
ncbi:unnamed protein product [Heligmosomoides polygyrus]|uniref:Uncharacterized protein n=1 Tax=Heligmosomoides polygyrus TaxID=6339 RepID=A0A183FGV9_HELPZ|nr:unnamed protein product [Heligmosomoides polygyrus]